MKKFLILFGCILMGCGAFAQSFTKVMYGDTACGIDAPRVVAVQDMAYAQCHYTQLQHSSLLKLMEEYEAVVQKKDALVFHRLELADGLTATLDDLTGWCEQWEYSVNECSQSYMPDERYYYILIKTVLSLL